MDNFNFNRSFFEACMELGDKEGAMLAWALIRYGYTGEEPKGLPKGAAATFRMGRERVDAMVAGARGGKSKAPRQAPTEAPSEGGRQGGTEGGSQPPSQGGTEAPRQAPSEGGRQGGTEGGSQPPSQGGTEAPRQAPSEGGRQVPPEEKEKEKELLGTPPMTTRQVRARARRDDPGRGGGGGSGPSEDPFWDGDPASDPIAALDRRTARA